MTQYKNSIEKPFTFKLEPYYGVVTRDVDRGDYYFITEQEYFEEGRHNKGINNLKSIEHNGVKYYYTSNISDKRAQRLAENHPGGPTPSLGRDPGGNPFFSDFYPGRRPKANKVVSRKVPDIPLFNIANEDNKTTTLTGTEDLNSYTYNLEELIDEHKVVGYGTDRMRHWADPKKKPALDNYYSQVEGLEEAVLGGVTSDSAFYEKFKEWYPEVTKPVNVILGQLVYPTDEEINDYFYDKIYQYYHSNPLLSKELGVDTSTPIEDLSPTQKKIRVMNSVVDPKLESAGIVTKENRASIHALSPAGKMRLLSSGYMSPAQINEQIRDYIDDNELPEASEGKVGEWLVDVGAGVGITATAAATGNLPVTMYAGASTITDIANHPYNVSTLRLFKAGREATADEARSDIVAYNQKILDAVIAEDNAYKETLVKKDTDQFMEIYKHRLDKGYITEEDLIKDFKSLASYMPHYAGIIVSGGDEFDNYPLERMIEDLSIYTATARNMGDEAAYLLLDSRFQNYVSDHQDGWDYVANTALGFATEFVADLGNKFIAVPTIPLGIIDAVTGSSLTADYLNSDVNTYLQDIRQYNTFNPEEISAVKKAGGVSSKTNIRPVGEELEVWSPYTIGDVIEQGGQLASMTAFGGTLNYGLGKIGRMGDRTRNFTVAGTSALGGAHAEATGAFQEAKESFNKTLDGAIEQQYLERKDDELARYLDSPQYISDIDTEFKKYRADDDYSGWDDKDLKKLAEKVVREDFLIDLKNSIKGEYAEAREQIDRYAVGSYFQAFILNGIKTSLANTIVLKNVFHKPMSKPRVPVKGTYENNRIKLHVPKITQYGRYAQKVGNVMLTEGLDEYFDGLFNDWAVLTGNDTYSRYLAERWDMGAYMSNSSNWFSGLLTQGSNVFSNRFADQYLFEGAIGAFSAGGININPVYGYKALRGQSLLTKEELAHNLAITNNSNLTDQQKADMLVELTVMEKAGRIFGGAMAAMAEVDTEFRNAIIEGTAAAENIAKYWEDFLGSTDLVSKLLAAKHSEGKSDREMQDAYDELSFALAVILVDSEEHLSKSGIELQQLEDLKALLNKAAEGDISDEDIDKFLSNPANKAFLQSLGN